MTNVAGASLFDQVADAAASESALWAEALRLPGERDPRPVFSSLVPDPEPALGVETIYEGYLVHYGSSRLFAAVDDDTALLLGDYLYAHGLVHVAAAGAAAAVHDLAELISLCAQGRADDRPGDGAAWAGTAALLGSGGLDSARASLRDHGDPAPLEQLARAACGDAAVDAALALHAALTAEGATARPVR